MTKIENKVDRVYRINGANMVVAGDAETEIKQIEMGRIKLVFLDPMGQPVVSPSKPIEAAELINGYYVPAFEPIITNRWMLYIDGQPQPYVKSIEIPRLSYSAPSEALTVKIEFYTEAIIARSKQVDPKPIKLVEEKES